MKEKVSYATATAFRRAVEDRLQKQARIENSDLQRLRRELAFDRLLARLFSTRPAPWVLKGGYAMELRLEEARATKDIDLAWQESFSSESRRLNQIVLEKLQNCAALDLKDYFVFLIGEAREEIESAPYGGARFPVEARMDGRSFVSFHLDVGIGDIVVQPYEEVRGHNLLEFAGIPPVSFLAIPAEQHFSEKIHAYTQPRETTNSRVRDLVDMVLLIESKKMDLSKIKKILPATFKKRKTHSLPKTLPPSPESWEPAYLSLAEQCDLNKNLQESFKLVDSYYNSIRG